ncbi:MAG: family 78 glycoside hydrolase catalytic domain, partial [Clostridia bacterium]|nr:family 78 glycoside hydrolase catalytic domain [Clostridia bacterium]
MIYDIKVNSMKNPLGIDDKNPRFSWKMKSDKRGTMQSAYQIIVSSDENFGQIIWDCGKIKSDKSIGIVYKGSPLKPKTRYYLKINLWDEENNLSSDDTAWFETGLMGTDSSVWNGAKWIGCPKKTTNASALDTYLLSADFKVEVSNKAGFVVAARNKDNYVLFEIDMDKRLLASYEYCDNAWDGSYESGNVPTVKALGNSKGYVIPENAVAYGREYAEHNFTLKVDGRAVTVLINGIKIIDNEKDFMPENKPNQPRKSYLMHIGFKQENSRAVYDNLTIANTFTGDIYQQDDFSDDAGAMSILGDVTDGKLIVENRFELACPVPSVNVKKDFSVEKKIRSARLYASARGFYNAYINGKKVGENFFDPGFTDYRLRIQYQTFDVTDMLCQGQNVIGATVGKGYYCGYVGYSGALIYGKQTSFIAQLTITYEDGATDTIVTDKSWKFTDKGPVADSDYLDGETYDARLDFDDWKKDFPSNCGEMPWPDAPKPTNREFEEKVPFELSAQIGPAAKVERTIAPICISENPKGHYIYDFGQNMVGTIRLAVKGERGASIKIRYGEMIYKNGEIYIKNLRTAANTDVYTLKGDPNGETFIPSYTSHGFRYVEITGNGFVLENPDIIVNIEGLVLCNIESVTGDFKCSNELVNKLQKNIKWGQRGNYLLVPTDCPQRNERMGWTGDAQVFAGTAAYNMDVAAFTEKWLQDLKDAQLMYNMDGAVPDTAPLGGDNRSDGCAGWADAAVIVPCLLYTS